MALFFFEYEKKGNIENFDFLFFQTLSTLDLKASWEQYELKK